MISAPNVISGFPTETDAMFENSLKLVEDCHLTWLHVFPYSPRPGTPAARMPQVNGNDIKARARRLREAGDLAAQKHLNAQIGKTHKVLIETPHVGRTDQFAEVRFEAPQPEGALISAKIIERQDTHLIGQPDHRSENTPGGSQLRAGAKPPQRIPFAESET